MNRCAPLEKTSSHRFATTSVCASTSFGVRTPPWKTNQFRCMPKYAMRGVPDIIVVHVGRLCFLEVKRPGTYQSVEQKEFQKQAKDAGALYAVVRSIEDVQAHGL